MSAWFMRGLSISISWGIHTNFHLSYSAASPNIVAAVAITDENGGDSPQFGSLVKKTAEGFTIDEVTADLAYSSRANLQTVENVGGKAYIPFKKNATGRAGRSAIWKMMYHYFQLNRDEFMEHYHQRSNIEATNAAIKRKFGETLKSKNPTAQVNELLAKIVAYNLTVVIHEMYENGINPDFLYRGLSQRWYDDGNDIC